MTCECKEQIAQDALPLWEASYTPEHALLFDGRAVGGLARFAGRLTLVGGQFAVAEGL